MKELSIDEMTSIRGGSHHHHGHRHSKHSRSAMDSANADPANATTSSDIVPMNIDSLNGNGALVFVIEGSNDRIIL